MRTSVTPSSSRARRAGVGFLFDLAVVVGIEDRRTDRLDRFDGLIHGHRVGLIDRKERDVDILEGFHFGRRLRIACDVDARAADGKDIAAVLAVFGVELQVPVGGVVGGYGLDLEVVARCGDAARAASCSSSFRTLRPRCGRRGFRFAASGSLRRPQPSRWS